MSKVLPSAATALRRRLALGVARLILACPSRFSIEGEAVVMCHGGNRNSKLGDVVEGGVVVGQVDGYGEVVHV